MSANVRLPGAPEILTLILASCDSFAEVIAFASCCREVYSVWKENASPILDRLGRQCIPAFQEALVAARALEIAKTAILNRKLPPKDINIVQLSAAFCVPRLSDMAAVRDLQRIVRFVEGYYLSSCPMCRHDGAVCRSHGYEGLEYESCTPFNLPPPEEWAENCRVSFHRAVYRVLLAGPILAGWYMEPFASEGIPNRLPPEFPDQLRLLLKQGWCDYPVWNDNPQLKDQDLAYLERFLPFDQDSNTRVSEKQDQMFRRLGDWLIESMKEHIAQTDLDWAPHEYPWYGGGISQELNLDGFRDGSIDEGVFILREIMRMLVAYESLANSLWNADDTEAHGRSGNNEGPPVIPKDGVWSPPFAIILGVYHLEQFQFKEPGALYHSEQFPMELGEHALFVTPIGRLPDACSLGPVPEEAVDIFFLQEYVYGESGRVNHIDGDAAAPPRLQLFSFLLRRFFNLGFRSGGIWNPSFSQDYYLPFLSDGLIFTNKRASDRTGILANRSPNPVYSFRSLY